MTDEQKIEELSGLLGLLEYGSEVKIDGGWRKDVDQEVTLKEYIDKCWEPEDEHDNEPFTQVLRYLKKYFELSFERANYLACINTLVLSMEFAIESGDWKVDGRNDPELILSIAKKILEDSGYGEIGDQDLALEA